MAKKQSTARAQKPAKRAAASSKASTRFTDEEREAMRDRVKELKAEGAADANTESEVLAKIAAMAASDRAMGQRLHAIITSNAPNLTPRLWYGMPAYAKDGHVVCFFQSAAKFKSRYCTLGFSDKAALDEGHMWPASFALTELGPADEAKIAALVKRAVR